MSCLTVLLISHQQPRPGSGSMMDYHAAMTWSRRKLCRSTNKREIESMPEKTNYTCHSLCFQRGRISLLSSSVEESESCSVVSDSLWPHGQYSPWNSPGQNTGVGSLSLLQRIFPTQGSNPGLPHCRLILYQLSHRGRPFSSRAVIKTHVWPCSEF